MDSDDKAWGVRQSHRHKRTHTGVSEDAKVEMFSHRCFSSVQFLLSCLVQYCLLPYFSSSSLHVGTSPWACCINATYAGIF